MQLEAFIRQSFSVLVAQIQKPETWGDKSITKSKHYQKYVGLRNLGTICYMNSILQQFFMIPTFRFNLLCLEDIHS